MSRDALQIDIIQIADEPGRYLITVCDFRGETMTRPWGEAIVGISITDIIEPVHYGVSRRIRARFNDRRAEFPRTNVCHVNSRGRRSPTCSKLATTKRNRVSPPFLRFSRLCTDLSSRGGKKKKKEKKRIDNSSH